MCAVLCCGMLCSTDPQHVHFDAAGQSMKHHMLSSYFHAVLSVALAQFSTTGFACGMPGIIRLAESSPYVQVGMLPAVVS